MSGHDIWIKEERTFGKLIKQGAHVSYVCYNYRGIRYEVYLENDDFLILDEQE